MLHENLDFVTEASNGNGIGASQLEMFQIPMIFFVAIGWIGVKVGWDMSENWNILQIVICPGSSV